MARLKLRDEGGSASSGDKKRGGKAHRGRSCTRDSGHRGGSSSSSRTRSPPSPCLRCTKTGHWAWDCPTKPKKEQAHLAQGEEDEPTLLMAHAFVSSALASASSPARSSRSVVNAASDPLCQQVHLDEGRVFAQLGPRTDQDPELWVLDTGATNHMTSIRGVFSELDSAITGTVRFGDGSVVEIEGCDTIVFNCKNGEHHALAGVYFIACLTASIISIVQLDEVGFKINI